ncbi:MAG TPA: Fe-S cluster assembly protein SufD, partial [Emcibacteraceae bacterium]|nr:Fe-S cluster assembly protein SufD [Emcibacteraceae bacterium]
KNHFDGLNYENVYAAQKNMLPGTELSWLNDIRQSSMTKFVEVGLPGPKVEEWRYTNLTPLKSETYEIADKSPSMSADILADLTVQENTGSKVVFINGYFSEAHSKIVSQSGIILKSLPDFLKSDQNSAQALLSSLDKQNSLEHLNTALMTGGYVLQVEENVKLAEPIEIFHIATKGAEAKALRSKCFIEMKSQSSACVIEHFSSPDGFDIWRDNVTRAQLSNGSFLSIYSFQCEGSEVIHMNRVLADLGEDAEFRHQSLNVGGKISRTEVKPTLNGLFAKTNLRGAFLGREGSSHDVFTHMKHMVPQGTSDQIYRGVLDKGGKSAFQGKAYVAKDAQLTNADQSNKNLLLDRGAEANSKPELLIYADDVKCSHGATVGELDDQALFYLESRGLDKNAAKGLLVEAFIAEVFEEIDLEAVKARYLDLARKWLDKG